MASTAPTAGSGHEVPITWRGRRARAFVPVPLARRELALDGTTVARTATAAAQVRAGAAALPADFEPLARLLLRAEGVASSFVEGIAAPLVDVALAEALHAYDGTPAAWIAANLAVVTDAVATAPDTALDVDVLCEWHRGLMAGSPLPGRYVGALRTEQGWIGGTSPLDAALVTPPPEVLPELLDDLVAYANRDDVDHVAQAAIAHAQFEVIHPFGDGNGRVGRVLVSWLLTRRLALVTPPPVSILVAADRDGYLAGLTRFRLGEHEAWIRWFADAVAGAGDAQVAFVRAVDELLARWRTRLGSPDHGRAVRRDALAWRMLDLVPRHLVLTAERVATDLGASARAARGALGALVDAGILVEHSLAERRGPGRPPRLYVSPDLLALVGAAPGVG